MIPLTNEENEHYEKEQVCYICKRIFNDENEFKLYHKVRDHCDYTGKFRGAPHSYFQFKIQNTKKNPIVFHNGSTYDYHFITNQPAK